uniref:FACT complex subunit n=2 Tax=Rhodosorus marinus TaxID=101924 RepID=A0A7S3A0J9_9RHOD|mmetsp:Transcript_38807/g.153304  ORF Transcript_38807/g.153304 Transcript_38807/m.153304 type:complete len:788 (+) Transcript_38807:1041-3404(+)
MHLQSRNRSMRLEFAGKPCRFESDLVLGWTCSRFDSQGNFIRVQALVEGQEAAIGALKQGQKLNTVFKTVAAKLNSKKEGLSSHLPKNIGFAIGIEYRDAAFVLNAKNERLLEPGMVFNVAVGLQNLKDSKKGDYALMVADTVVVPKEGESPVVYTQSCKKAFKSISYKLQDEEQEDEEEDEDDLLIREAELQTGSRRSRHAKSASEIAGTTEEIEKRKKHQEELARRMLEEGKARLGDAKSTDPSKKAGKEKTLDEYIAYESPEAYPASLKPRQIYVDMQNESILLPINGVPVPFHISAVKNVGKIEEGDNSYIRINFHFPASGNINNRNKADAPKFPDPEKDFIKEMTFRSANSDNINESVRRIRELRRRFVSQLQEESKPEVQVQQENLILDRSATRKPYLNDVAIRPSVQSGKGNKGILEAHTNGFRFRTAKGVHIDVIYANVKHAFFQEAKSEVIVLLHFNLIHPIMIRNKKTNDVQFYVEVMESAVKLNETRRKAYDQDELVEEQRERERRNRMNNIFLKFTKDVEEKYNLEFDAPYRNLGFHGAPKNANVFLMPTVSCIVSLVDWPPFILSLQNVELAYLERVSFSLKNFDLVFVFKDFVEETAKGVSWSRISSIPTQELDPLRKFLDEQEIKYYEGSTNLVWDNVLSNIRENYADFVESGGWNFLEDKEDEEGVEQEDELEEGDEEFELEEESAEDEESEEESDDYEESDDSGDAFEDELGGDSAEGEAELSSDEEGMSWDELEKKAAREDADRGGSDDDRRRSREKRGKYSAGSKRRR